MFYANMLWKLAPNNQVEKTLTKQGIFLVKLGDIVIAARLART